MRTKDDWIYAAIVCVIAIGLTAVMVWGMTQPRSQPGEDGFVVPL